MQAVGPDGPYGDVTWVPEIEYERSTYQALRGFEAATPFSAALVWNPAPEGKLLFGASDQYRFEVHAQDGRKLVVERYWEPVPVPAEHRDWERRRAIAFQRRLEPEFMWDGAEIPDHKPAYWSLIPSLSGEIWVMRPGASRRLSDCAEDPIAEGHPAGSQRPCWTDERIVDVFGDDGRYLGEVDVPEEFQGGPHSVFADASRVVAVVQNDAGTIMVKRYRLVLPGER